MKEYYGDDISSTTSLKTSACSASSKPHAVILKALKLVPESVKSRYFGCGSSFPLGITGLDVLDLGCGSGRDSYVAAVVVGPKGSVIGIDMTEKQLQVARNGVHDFCASLSYTPKLEFRNGVIEDLRSAGVASESVDVIISNCVVNLSPQKDLVFREAFRSLRFGGEFYFSDMYCDRRNPERIKTEKVLWGEGLAGAMYVNDFLDLCRDIGFMEPRQLESRQIFVTDENLQDAVGNAVFYSITFRLFKIHAPYDASPENYGQIATYKGSIEGYSNSYLLDEKHVFVTGKAVEVSGNTAAILTESWLKVHFEVKGSRDTHYGAFIE